MPAKKISRLSWLPFAAAASTAIGAILVAAMPDSLAPPLGWLLLLLGILFLWLWQQKMRSALSALSTIKAYESWDDLPRIWSNMERENQTLKDKAQKEAHLLRSILESLNVGVVVLGSYKQILTFNIAAQNLLGSSSQVLLKGTASGILNDPESLRMIDKAYGGEACSWNRERSGRILSFHAAPLAISQRVGDSSARTLEGQLGTLLVIQDITQQEALEQTRQKFISNAGHELKTPVTSIRVAAENLAEDGWVHPEGESYIKIILRNVDRMVLLLNDIAELSRIETGALSLEPVPIEVGPFLADIIENAHPLANYKNIAIGLEIEPGLDQRKFICDPLRLNQLLENLLSNAIKFSPAKSPVVLSAHLDGPWIVFSVRDNGPGISLKDAPRIFERFYRTQAARGVPGTGLGLAIVKHLARTMGGEVSFDSEPEKETTFYFKLPWKAASQVSDPNSK
ncbi:MAG: PAS domain-containing sensor histidine kinase [Holophagales bacterium]|jgi:signal transduction histidine kinase|nr:PAS domain-containing sensor histidine kinase [Holophagales bacterium]